MAVDDCHLAANRSRSHHREWKSRSAAAVAATASVLLPHFYAIAGGGGGGTAPDKVSFLPPPQLSISHFTRIS